MLLMLILYRVLLDLVYVQCITGVYAYMGMSCEKPELFQAILYWIVYLCFSLWCIRLSRGSHLSELVLMFLFLTSFAPAMTMFTYRKADHSFLYILYWLCLAVLHLAIPPRSKKHRIQAGDKAVRIVSYACLALSLFIWGFYAHFHIQISLTDVYDQRAAAREYGMPTIVTYLYGSLNVIIPTFVIYALKNRKKPRCSSWLSWRSSSPTAARAPSSWRFSPCSSISSSGTTPNGPGTCPISCPWGCWPVCWRKSSCGSGSSTVWSSAG